jgi:hypothetical protein
MNAIRIARGIPFALLSVLSMSTHGQVNLVPAPQAPPWCPAGTGCTSEVHTTYLGSDIRGAVSFRAGADGIFDRPLLLVEGFDFGGGWDPNSSGYGNVTWNDIHAGDLVNFPQGLDYRPLLDSLHQRGWDLLFVDFEHGTASLKAKSALLDHVLTLTLASKTGAHPSVLAGVSMGGLVVRATLAQWEQAGAPHCIGQYYSVDSPHLGATLPVGLQGLVLGLSTLSSDGSELWQALNSAAARELLQHHIAGDDSFQETQNHLLQLGWPTRSVNLNIVNSHPEGAASLADGDLIYLEWGLPPPISLNTFHVKASRWTSSPSPSLAATFCLPTGDMPWAEGGAIHVGSLSFPQPTTDPESLPGSTSSHISRISEALKASLAMLPLMSETVQPNVTFVSHASALGIGAEGCEPWTGISLAPSYAPREEHASLGNHHRTWMLSWLEALETTPPAALPDENQSGWTLGWQAPRQKHLHGLEIHEGGLVTVGNNATPFEAFTSPCPGEVAVMSGGALRVGSADGAVGKLRIGAGTSVSVRQGGVLSVHSGSKLTVEKHGTLLVDGGKLTVHDAGCLVLEAEGRIVLQNGAQLHLTDPASGAELHGRITVLAGSHAIVHNCGNVELGSNSDVWLEPGSALHWDQINSGITRLTGAAAFQGDGHADMNGGLWLWEENASLACNADVRWHLADLLASDAESDHVTTTRNVSIEKCDVGGLRWLHNSNPEHSTLIRIRESTFEHSFSRLTHAQVQLLDNELHHSPVEVSHPKSPTKFVQNHVEGTWTSSTPGLTLKHAENALWLEDNSWEGGVGLRLVNTSISSSCNRWSGCACAIQIAGESEACFQGGCGGGSNRWWDNQIHFHLENAPFPLLGMGNNHLGEASEEVLSGTTTNPGPTWVVDGASWDASLLENPWFSPFPSSVEHCIDGDCEDIPCWAQGILAQTSCSPIATPKPVKTKSTGVGVWNTLGQLVPEAVDGQSGIRYSWK